MKAYIQNFTGNAVKANQSPLLSTLIEDANNGTLSKEDKDYIFNYSGGTTARGICKHLGWLYNFQPVMSLFVVSIRDFGLFEVYAFSKGQVRQMLEGWGKIRYIIPAPNQH